MMRPLPNIIKAIVLLIFINLLLLINYLQYSYFVLFGIFFLENISATVLILFLFFIAGIAGFSYTKRKKSVYRLTQAFAAFLFLNSLTAIIASLFFAEDLTGFLNDRIFGENIFTAFVASQILVMLVNLILIIAVRHSRSLLKLR